MADDFYTTADQLADALDLAPFELSEIRDAAPLMASLPVITSSDGELHKFSVDTVRPVVGWRGQNLGRDLDKSVHRIDSITLKILDFSWAADKAVADVWRQGGSAAFIAREGLQHLKAAMFRLEEQFVNGQFSGVATGHKGLADSANLNAIADDMVTDAEGTTAATASSVYLLRVSPSECAAISRGDGVQLGNTVVQDFTDGSGLHYPAYYTPATTWTGAQIGAKFSAARIVNLTEDTGKGLTDDLLYKASNVFPAGLRPNLVVMSLRSLEQLRLSRTATNVTGAPAPTPMMTGDGIRIVTTDALSDTEALIA